MVTTSNCAPYVLVDGCNQYGYRYSMFKEPQKLKIEHVYDHYDGCPTICTFRDNWGQKYIAQVCVPDQLGEHDPIEVQWQLFVVPITEVDFCKLQDDIIDFNDYCLAAPNWYYYSLATTKFKLRQFDREEELGVGHPGECWREPLW